MAYRSKYSLQVAEELALMLLEAGWEVYRHERGGVRVYNGGADIERVVTDSPEELLNAYEEIVRQRNAALEPVLQNTFSDRVW